MIKLSPQNRPDDLTLERDGDTLTINGEPFDFDQLPPGGVLPSEAVASEFIEGNVERDESGELHITIRWPYKGGGDIQAPGPISDDARGVLIDTTAEAKP